MYSFKHALTQDVVYARRAGAPATATYHTAAGSASRSYSPRRIDDVVELVALPLQARPGVGQGGDLFQGGRRLKALADVGEPRGAGLPRRSAGGVAAPARDAGDAREQGDRCAHSISGAPLYPLGEFEKMLAYLREAEAMAPLRDLLIRAPARGWSPSTCAEYFRQRGRFAEARTLASKRSRHGRQASRRSSPLNSTRSRLCRARTCQRPRRLPASIRGCCGPSQAAAANGEPRRVRRR